MAFVRNAARIKRYSAPRNTSWPGMIGWWIWIWSVSSTGLDHDVLMARVARRVKDKQMVRLIRRVETGERVMTLLESFLSKRLRLPINREKSAVARPRARKFLGYTVTTSRKLKVAPQSLRRLQGRIRALCRQARGWRLDRLIETLRPIIRGWIAYFQLSEVKVAFVRLE